MESAKLREMQEKTLEGQAHDLARIVQAQIDQLDVKKAILDEIEEIHNRK